MMVVDSRTTGIILGGRITTVVGGRMTGIVLGDRSG